MKRATHATVVFFGEAATEEGSCSESLNFAALKQLPLVFFCENNFYSVQSPLSTRQPPRSLRKWAEGFGLPAVEVDGMNVLAVYEASRDAVERARNGGGRRSSRLSATGTAGMVDPGTTPGPAIAPRTSGTRGIRSTRCLCTFST